MFQLSRSRLTAAASARGAEPTPCKLETDPRSVQQEPPLQAAVRLATGDQVREDDADGSARRAQSHQTLDEPGFEEAARVPRRPGKLAPRGARPVHRVAGRVTLRQSLGQHLAAQ